MRYRKRSDLIHRSESRSGPESSLQADLLPLAGHLGTSLGAVDAAGQVQEAVATDAFGQLRIPGSPANPGGFTSAPAGGWQQSHLFAGEYWDQDSQLLYLRARWYDPQIGRFISADPFEGRQTDPKSLNRYSYAHGDPVHGTDPTGAFSMGELNSGLNVQGVLVNAAKDQAIGYLQDRIFGGDDKVDGPPSLYEMLLATLVKSVAGSIGTGGGAVAAFPGAASGLGPTRNHHTIPEYMCGAGKQEEVALPKAVHDRLHNELYHFQLGVKIAATAYDMAFRWKKKGGSEIRAPIAEIARTPYGRQAIIVGLGLFYQNHGYGGTMYSEWGSGLSSRKRLQYVFMKESFRFAGAHHSYPVCKKK